MKKILTILLLLVSLISFSQEYIMTSWLNSPLHKEVLEYDDTYLSWIPSMERHTVIVYMYKVEGEYGGVRILVVYQNRHPKQYYIDSGYSHEDI
jgi:hypothetical protein